mmetsp:Transcript_7294/g.10437  ORF Transcript_7294/g.10437 Transcript_7294/m.10437 type:complete len:203 (-) Transcript_7294:716-1324(-)
MYQCSVFNWPILTLNIITIVTTISACSIGPSCIRLHRRCTGKFDMERCLAWIICNLIDHTTVQLNMSQPVFIIEIRKQALDSKSFPYMHAIARLFPSRSFFISACFKVSTLDYIYQRVILRLIGSDHEATLYSYMPLLNTSLNHVVVLGVKNIECLIHDRLFRLIVSRCNIAFFEDILSCYTTFLCVGWVHDCVQQCIKRFE